MYCNLQHPGFGQVFQAHWGLLLGAVSTRRWHQNWWVLFLTRQTKKFHLRTQKIRTEMNHKSVFTIQICSDLSKFMKYIFLCVIYAEFFFSEIIYQVEPVFMYNYFFKYLNLNFFFRGSLPSGDCLYCNSFSFDISYC